MGGLLIKHTETHAKRVETVLYNQRTLSQQQIPLRWGMFAPPPFFYAVPSTFQPRVSVSTFY